MLGAIAGDIIGSFYEVHNLKSKKFPLFGSKSCFTDDTVLTVAVADVLLHNGDYVVNLKKYHHRYPNPYAGYGQNFDRWAMSNNNEPYNSWGNGSAMRVSPVGFAFDDLETVLLEAKKSAEVTHNHPEGIKGAQATAAAILLGRQGKSKPEIKTYIESNFGYNLSRKLDEIRPDYQFHISCQGSVPEAIIAFLESTDFEDAIRNAVSLGGDSDTIACIAGGIAQAYYGSVPETIAQEALARLDKHLRHVTETFLTQYNLK
ncbi:MAG: ADP-ribosylglycohydrolase family protein [Oscillatoria sp. PMC 1068.18]|nr:ADP-ribosylglycohydrolase family protein [Oscillatoria sp. PMC 1076.18]MEC4987984.1 ADP-ribosylglycohydrolase family protein [Oscillatoria sp. PMC 1068.18]